jgi:hypothetical protein
MWRSNVNARFNRCLFMSANDTQSVKLTSWSASFENV